MSEGNKGAAASAVVQHAVRGLGHLLSLQMLTRALTFLLNVLVVRRVDRAVTGAAGVQLQLVLALALSLSRDVARRLYARILFALSPEVVHSKQQQQQRS